MFLSKMTLCFRLAGKKLTETLMTFLHLFEQILSLFPVSFVIFLPPIKFFVVNVFHYGLIKSKKFVKYPLDCFKGFESSDFIQVHHNLFFVAETPIPLG